MKLKWSDMLCIFSDTIASFEEDRREDWKYIKGLTEGRLKARSMSLEELSSFMERLEKDLRAGAVSRGMIKYTLTFVNVNHGSQFQEFLGYEVLPTTIEEDMMDVLIGE